MSKWNLTEHYSGIDDPKINKDIQKVRELIDSFNLRHKGKINSPNITPAKMAKVFEQFIEILELAHKYEIYAGLLHAKNSIDPAIGAFYQHISEIGAKDNADLLWFPLERKEWSEERAREMINSTELAKYKHFLEFERVFIPHILSEKEERILSFFSPVGSQAFVRFYDETQGHTEFELEVNGRFQKLSLAEVSKIMSYHEDGSVRERATKVVAESFKSNSLTYTFILNTLLLDSKIEDEVRGYKYPQESTFLGYEVMPETVSNMTEEVEANYSTVERFYKAKARILGVEKLYEWDRYSDVYPLATKKVSWEEAKSLVLAAFEKFDSGVAAMAVEFFDKGWIDAEITKGKQNGAFCSYGTPSTHPFILVNFTGELSDVLTLAHELGHGIHAYLSKKQSILEFHSSTAVAEIASVFAESLVFDLLQEEIDKVCQPV